MNEIIVEELRVGKVKHLGKKDAKNPLDRAWSTGMFKQPQSDQLFLTKTGLETDEIGDLKAHGGPEKALFAYPAKHYAYWQKELDVEIGKGGMGENLVLQGVDETEVCLGDQYAFGEAIIEVSQPRQPCWKPARRYRIMNLAIRIQKSRKTGWYYRVLKEGYVSHEDQLKRIARPYPEWTVDQCNVVMHEMRRDYEMSKKLAEVPALAANWQRRLEKRIRGRESGIESRVFGPNKDE